MKRRTMQQRMANGPERLETRTLLAADVGAAGTRQLQWEGRLVEAFADAWIVRAADPAAASLALTADWRAVSLGEGFFSLTTPGAAPADVAAWAASAAGVATIEPDSVITSAAVPNDPSFGQLWGLSNTGQSGGLRDADIDAPEAWDITTGSRSVVVAVIDTGVDHAHRDLAANAWRNPGEVAGDRIDNDGNGFVDDVYGWDFANNDADPMDDQGHGTHVAGTIGAVGNNGSGVVGVSWNVSIMGLKFLGANGSGSTSGAVAAINYATRMRRDFGINIVATNNSWGGGGSSTSLRDAIAAGGRAGILFVAAAGNEATNIDATPAYPAAYTDEAIISVAATDRSNNLASFSNYGVTGVDLAAPGVSIYSTVPGNAYATYSGTSMATPHVTGTIALMAAANPQATAAQLRSAVISTAVPVASLAGKVATGGLLNAAAAVQAITGVQPPVDPPVDPPPPPAVEPLEPNDSLATATPVAFVDRRASVTAVIGDGSNLAADIDLFAIVLAAGETLTVDIDAATLAEPSELDSFLRVFDAGGVQLAANDDAVSSLDSLLSFVAPATGTYYVGISAFGNSAYNPVVAGSGQSAGTTGGYAATFIVTPLPVTADVIDVSPDPRTTSVEAVLVQFSRAVAGFDVADLALTRDGVTVSLAAASVSSTDGIRWTVAGLAAATATAGAYVLTVNAAGSGIVATDGGLFATNATDAWMTTAAALVDAGDTLTTAAAITATTGDLRLAGRVGDGAQTTRDVDLYRVRLAAGQRLVIDIDARSLAGSSTLDSYLRVFDSRGSQLAANDDAAGSLDSYLAFTARTAGTYFVGISGYGNTAYNPARAGSGRPGSTGVYQVAFGFGALPSRGSSVRTAGFRDTTSATARHAAFAAYGVNWLAALPAATPTQRRK
jgi:subtilisin family serine protease